jgi:SAM-dependent methyltransferase
MSDLMKRFYPESRFGHFSNVDGTIAFYLRTQALVSSESVVLDLGCGRGEAHEDPVAVRRELRTFKGKVKRVVGLDVDRAGFENPLLDEFRQITDQENWPMESNQVDLCVCDYVLEHIEKPDTFMREVCRILRPGGYFCARTSNAWGYVGLISRLTPNRFHAAITGKVQTARQACDVFPTVYLCNSVWRLRSLLRRAGLQAQVWGSEAEPNYLTFSSILYGLGVLYQRMSPGFIRNGLVAFAQKPS